MPTVYRTAPYVVPSTLTVTIAPHLHQYLAVEVVTETASCSRLTVVEVMKPTVCLVAELQTFTSDDVRVSTFEPTPLAIVVPR